MSFVITSLQLAAVWLIAHAMGMPIVRTLLPRDLQDEHGILIAPTVGYLAFCLLSFSASAAFGLSAATACWIVFGMLIAWAGVVLWRGGWPGRAVFASAGRVLAIILPMACVTLWPVLYFGADAYLGAVNPDFFAGLLDNYFLLKGYPVTHFAPEITASFYPMDYMAGHLSPSARFGGGMFGILVHMVLGVEMRTALSLIVGFFLLSLPATVYFLCRTAMAMSRSEATVAAWLIGVSAPIGMSYLYYYLGQNSGLPALPLVMACGFLMLSRPGVRTLFLCALLSNALFVNYFAMLPYALAPAGALGLYLVATRRLAFTHALALAAGFLGFSVLLKFGSVGYTITAMKAWMNVIGQSLQGQFFLDFLTESFFPYFFGVYNYPANPWLVKLLGAGGAKFAGLALSLVILLTWLWFFRDWVRRTQDGGRRVFIVSALVIYTLVWYRYTFVQQYGYAVFKMSSWLQFVLVPFLAYGMCRVPALWREVRGRWWMAAPALVATVVLGSYAMLNVVSNTRYAINGMGTNVESGYIVNHFGMAGNRDYFEVPGALAKFVKPEESIGLIFTDSIRQYWASWYAKSFRQSILSHETMPGDDENLPDIENDAVVDYYGNVRYAINDFLHGGASDQYYLTWNAADINQDITTIDYSAKPLWQNDSFRLFRAGDLRDILFTGKGFYRLEYFKPISEYFFPRVLRWSAEGGEFFLLHPSRPGMPYQLAFDAFAGYRHANDRRTLEIWHNKQKIQELTIEHSARVLTQPFLPTEGLNVLAVRIKERNLPIPRRLIFWNKDIPEDYRRLNVAFANVSVVTPDKPPRPVVPQLGVEIHYMKMHASLEQFNGIEVDGWIGRDMSFTVPLPPGASEVEVGGMLPGNYGFTFPFEMSGSINGREFRKTLDAWGRIALVFPVIPGETSATIVIKAPMASPVGEVEIRHKVIERSWRLDWLTIR